MIFIFLFQVAFDPNVKTRTVTLEGDVFDPSGTLSGGKHIIFIFVYFYFYCCFDIPQKQ